MELLKLLNAHEVIVQILSFLLLFFLLRTFFWKKFLKLLDERKERISRQLKDMEEQKAQIEKMRTDYAQRLESVENAAKTKIQEAINQGRKITEELKNKAKDESEKIIEHAKIEARNEVVRAKEMLKDEVADLVLNATERLLQEKVTKEKDKELVKEFIEKLDKAK
jgi:F-type H+-transporting ATPase subunit b